jgi:hypothetical protein
MPGKLQRKGALSDNTVITSAPCNNSEHVCIYQQILPPCESNILRSEKKKDEPTSTTGDFNDSLPKMDRATRYMISNDIAQLNNSWVPVHVTGINRSLLPATDYTFLPSTCGQPPAKVTFSAIKYT